MKTLAKIHAFLVEKNPKYPSNLSVIKSLVLVLFVTCISGFVSICFAQSPWTPIQDMPRAKEGHSACFLDGKLYVMGGLDYYAANEGNFAFRELHVYDPILDDWTEKTEMLNRRYNFSSCAYDGKILAIGGSTDIYWTPVSAIDAYDPASDTWNHITDIPKPGVWQAAVLLEDRIYVIGGAATEREFPYTDSTLQIYDLLTDTWSMGADILTPRAGHSAVVLNGKIYALGGQQGRSTGFLGIDAVEEYDPETDTWIKAASMIFPRKHHESVSLDGKIHVFGGGSGLYGDKLWAGEIYDPYTDSWRELSSALTQWGLCAASESNGKMFIGGGAIFQSLTEFMYLKCWYIYDPRFDLYPMLKEVKVNKIFVNAGDDTLLISANMNEAVGITLQAITNTLEGTLIDSLMLYDDGKHQDGSAEDSLFANSWPVTSAEELQYSLGIKVTRTDTVTVFNQFSNQAVITTRGLATVDSFVQKDSTCKSFFGDCIWTTLIIRNNSSQYPAREIKVELESMDTLAWPFNRVQVIETIPAADYTKPMDFKLIISEELQGSRDIPIVVNISSFGNVFRSDTIPVSLTVGISNTNNNISPIKIYPNPTDDLITIETGQTGPLWIKMTSLNGQKVFEEERMGDTQLIDLTSFQKGVYIISIRSKGSVTTEKIIKL